MISSCASPSGRRACWRLAAVFMAAVSVEAAAGETIPGCANGWRRSPVFAAVTWIPAPDKISVADADYRGFIVDLLPNPEPAKIISSRSGFMASGEFRGLTLAQLRLCVEEDRFAAVELDVYRDPGYTPIKIKKKLDIVGAVGDTVTDSTRDVVKKVLFNERTDYERGESNPAVDKEPVKVVRDEDDRGFRVVILNAFRIGLLGRIGAKSIKIAGDIGDSVGGGGGAAANPRNTKFNVPYAWHGLTLSVKNGTPGMTAALNGSAFPNHALWADGRRQGDGVLVDGVDSIRAFLNSEDGALAESARSAEPLAGILGTYSKGKARFSTQEHTFREPLPGLDIHRARDLWLVGTYVIDLERGTVTASTR